MSLGVSLLMLFVSCVIIINDYLHIYIYFISYTIIRSVAWCHSLNNNRTEKLNTEKTSIVDTNSQEGTSTNSMPSPALGKAKGRVTLTE